MNPFTLIIIKSAKRKLLYKLCLLSGKIKSKIFGNINCIIELINCKFKIKEIKKKVNKVFNVRTKVRILLSYEWKNGCKTDCISIHKNQYKMPYKMESVLHKKHSYKFIKYIDIIYPLFSYKINSIEIQYREFIGNWNDDKYLNIPLIKLNDITKYLPRKKIVELLKYCCYIVA